MIYYTFWFMWAASDERCVFPIKSVLTPPQFGLSSSTVLCLHTPSTSGLHSWQVYDASCCPEQKKRKKEEVGHPVCCVPNPTRLHMFTPYTQGYHLPIFHRALRLLCIFRSIIQSWNFDVWQVSRALFFFFFAPNSTVLNQTLVTSNAQANLKVLGPSYTQHHAITNRAHLIALQPQSIDCNWEFTGKQVLNSLTNFFSGLQKDSLCCGLLIKLGMWDSIHRWDGGFMVFIRGRRVFLQCTHPLSEMPLYHFPDPRV